MMKLLILAPTAKERCGIAEYTRQAFEGDGAYIKDLTWWNCFTAPFTVIALDFDALHVQFEFFLFDRIVGVSAFFWFAWWRLLGARIVTTVHSTYDTDNLWAEFPQFHHMPWAFWPGKLYLSALYWWICALSKQVITLCPAGRDKLSKHTRKPVHMIPIPPYRSVIKAQDHGRIHYPFFTCLGFCFPNKGFDVAIEAIKLLNATHPEVKLFIVGGAPIKPGSPWGDAHTHGDDLRKLVDERNGPVRFTGYLNTDDPLLEEIVLKTKAFVFPYRERNCPSGAFQTALATGRPLLTSTAKCFDGHNWLVKFPIDDAAALAELMRQVLNDPHRFPDPNIHGFLSGRDDCRKAHEEVYRKANENY